MNFLCTPQVSELKHIHNIINMVQGSYVVGNCFSRKYLPFSEPSSMANIADRTHILLFFYFLNFLFNFHNSSIFLEGNFRLFQKKKIYASFANFFNFFIFWKFWKSLLLFYVKQIWILWCIKIVLHSYYKNLFHSKTLAIRKFLHDFYVATKYGLT